MKHGDRRKFIANRLKERTRRYRMERVNLNKPAFKSGARCQPLNQKLSSRPETGKSEAAFARHQNAAVGRLFRQAAAGKHKLVCREKGVSKLETDP